MGRRECAVAACACADIGVRQRGLHIGRGAGVRTTELLMAVFRTLSGSMAAAVSPPWPLAPDPTEPWSPVAAGRPRVVQTAKSRRLADALQRARSRSDRGLSLASATSASESPRLACSAVCGAIELPRMFGTPGMQTDRPTRKRRLACGAPWLVDTVCVSSSHAWRGVCCAR